MFAINPESFHILGQGIESWKLWGFLLTSFGTAVIGGYKIYVWIRDIRTKDLVEVKEGVSRVTAKIEETSAAQLRSTEFQTQSLVRELSELRGLFYGAFHVPPMQKMAPARKKAAAKPRVTKKVNVQLVLDNDQ